MNHRRRQASETDRKRNNNCKPLIQNKAISKPSRLNGEADKVTKRTLTKELHSDNSELTNSFVISS